MSAPHQSDRRLRVTSRVTGEPAGSGLRQWWGSAARSSIHLDQPRVARPADRPGDSKRSASFGCPHTPASVPPARGCWSCGRPRLGLHDTRSALHTPGIKIADDDSSAHHQITIAGDGRGDPIDVRRLLLCDIAERLAVEASESQDGRPSLVQAGQADARAVDPPVYRAVGVAGAPVGTRRDIGASRAVAARAAWCHRWV